MSTALTESMDVAQIVLYAFWAFFFGLIYWLRKEDRREGYPLESDNPRRVGPENQILIPSPKTFLLPHGGEAQAPNFARDDREVLAERTANSAGSPLEPTGDPMLSAVGPASFAQRSDEPELTREGHDLIVPMRAADGFAVMAGPDPRGWDVVATDGKVAGTVKDIWVDRADVMVRYLEVELAEAEGTRLLPITMLRLRAEPKKVEVTSVRADHFASVPTLKEPDRVTLLEEDQICAFYAGGRLYAEPKRLGPVV
jgi:photosynthetic reaction center H subunit